MFEIRREGGLHVPLFVRRPWCSDKQKTYIAKWTGKTPNTTSQMARIDKMLAGDQSKLTSDTTIVDEGAAEVARSERTRRHGPLPMRVDEANRRCFASVSPARPWASANVDDAPRRHSAAA